MSRFRAQKYAKISGLTQLLSTLAETRVKGQDILLTEGLPSCSQQLLYAYVPGQKNSLTLKVSLLFNWHLAFFASRGFHRMGKGSQVLRRTLIIPTPCTPIDGLL